MYLCIVLFTLSHPAAAVELDSQTLLYSIQYDSYDAGELEVVIENAGDTIKTTTTSRLNGLARLFLPEHISETRYRADSDAVALEGGNLRDRNSDRIIKGYLIDRNQGVINFLTAASQPILEDDQLDSSDFPILVMTTGIKQIAGMTTREITPEKSRYYVYESPVEEALQINGVLYRTWKVVRRKRSEETRSVTVWLDAGNQLVPLRIVSTKRNRDTVLTLLNHRQDS